jgi:hypothetical protein
MFVRCALDRSRALDPCLSPIAGSKTAMWVIICYLFTVVPFVYVLYTLTNTICKSVCQLKVHVDVIQNNNSSHIHIAGLDRTVANVVHIAAY